VLVGTGGDVDVVDGRGELETADVEHPGVASGAGPERSSRPPAVRITAPAATAAKKSAPIAVAVARRHLLIC
jgi:hypothetical protein